MAVTSSSNLDLPSQASLPEETHHSKNSCDLLGNQNQYSAVHSPNGLAAGHYDEGRDVVFQINNQ